MSYDYSKIVIINLGGIGDLLLSQPALKALKQRYPNAKITLLVVKRVAELVRRWPFLDEVLIFGKHFRDSLADLATFFFLRRRGVDLAINMRTLVSKKSGRKIRNAFFIMGAKTTAGRDTNGLGSFFKVKIPEANPAGKYEMEYDIALVEALGAHVNSRDVDSYLTRDDMHRIDQLLEDNRVKNDEIVVGVHPGGMPSRRWSEKSFAQAMEEIDRQIGCRFVLTGTASEVGLIKKINFWGMVKPIVAVNQLSIYETIALIRRCDLFISNDTGPMHIAAALKTPLIAIFGPGQITRYDPSNISQNTIVLRKEVPCAPCEKSKCDHKICLDGITVKDVAGAARRLLNL